MADVITRFKLETTQYDSKLRDASQGLSKLSQQLQLAGKDFDRFAQKDVEVAKAFGQIESGATNLKDKLKDLVGAYNNVAKAYNQLTNEQKSTDFGKAMASSLDQLKGRITQTKTELYKMDEESNKSSGILDALAGKFGLNVEQLGKLSVALGAASAAVKVAKDAFFASEANVDEWGRTVEASKSVYEGFLIAINTGDISGYLSRIDEIVSAARTAYNELDRLGTMKTIQAPQKSAQQTENERIRQMIQTGRYIAPIDGRKPSPGMTDGQLLTPEQIRRLEQQLQNGMKTAVSLIENEVKQTSKAIDAVYDRQAKELGMSLSEFRKGTSSMAEFDKRMEEARAYQEFEANKRQAQAWADSGHNLTPEQAAMINATNPNKRGAQWSTFRVDGERYNELVQLILQRDQQAAQAYGMQSQAYRTINRAEGITTRSLLGGGGGSGKGGKGGTKTEASIDELLSEGANEVKSKAFDFSDAAMGATQSMKQLQDILKRYNDALLNATNTQEYNAALSGIEATQSKINAQPTALKTGLSIEEVQFNDEIKTQLQDMKSQLEEEFKNNPLQIEVTGGQKLKKLALANEEAWNGVADALQSAGSALGAFEDPSLNIAATIATSLANVAMAFSQALKGTATPWDFIAGVAGGVAAMASAVAAIKSVASEAEGFAEGGIVGGNTYSGDQIPIMANAGELILNKAAQGNLASLLQDGRSQGGTTHAIINSDNIKIALRNGAEKRGKTLRDYLEI